MPVLEITNNDGLVPVLEELLEDDGFFPLGQDFHLQHRSTRTFTAHCKILAITPAALFIIQWLYKIIVFLPVFSSWDTSFGQ